MKKLALLFLLVAGCVYAQGTTAVCNLTANTSAANCKSAPGQVLGWTIYNPNASVCYLQLFNLTSSGVTLGTSTEVINIPVPATSGSNMSYIRINFPSFISAGSTTAAHGGSTCGTGMIVQLFYQ